MFLGKFINDSCNGFSLRVFEFLWFLSCVEWFMSVCVSGSVCFCRGCCCCCCCNGWVVMVKLWSLYKLVIGFIRIDEDGVVIVDDVEVGIRSMRFGHSGISVKT